MESETKRCLEKSVDAAGVLVANLRELAKFANTEKERALSVLALQMLEHSVRVRETLESLLPE